MDSSSLGLMLVVRVVDGREGFEERRRDGSLRGVQREVGRDRGEEELRRKERRGSHVEGRLLGVESIKDLVCSSPACGWWGWW